jgi:hypothetical protein
VSDYILPGKTYKVFLVEEDDDLRERVVSALSRDIVIDYEAEFTDLLCDDRMFARCMHHADHYTITIKLCPREDGTYITVEDFSNDVYDYNESEDL